MIKTLKLDHLMERIEADAIRFRGAEPYPHIVFDDILANEMKEQILSSFPTDAWEGWHRFQDNCQFKKLACDRIDRIPGPLDRILLELNSGPFLSWLAQLTGIKQLLPDPWLEGGGLHSSGVGGFLVPHVDFHTGRLDHLFRRLNLIIYLNPHWSMTSGGALELWDKRRDRMVKQVLPEFGRCVIFQTDAHSLHGFSKPLVDRDRNSIAVYYYTTAPPDEFAGDGSTHWRAASLEARSGDKRSKLRTAAYRVCMGLSYRISRLAWQLRSH